MPFSGPPSSHSSSAASAGGTPFILSIYCAKKMSNLKYPGIHPDWPLILYVPQQSRSGCDSRLQPTIEAVILSYSIAGGANSEVDQSAAASSFNTLIVTLHDLLARHRDLHWRAAATPRDGAAPEPTRAH